MILSWMIMVPRVISQANPKGGYDMVLQRGDPFRELRPMERTMDRLWRGFGLGEEFEHWAVPLDVVKGVTASSFTPPCPASSPRTSRSPSRRAC